jgi:hypothetical protein
MSCDEFLSFDTKFHKNKGKLEAIAISVKLPSNSTALAVITEAKVQAASQQMGLLDSLKQDARDEE